MRTKAVTIKVGDVTFTADLAVVESKGFPGKDMVSSESLGQFERAVAAWLIEHGAHAPEALKWLRSAAGLTSSQLAELLGVARQRVSEWETGKHYPGVALWNTYADLALDAIAGRTTTVDRLRATQTEQQTAGEIRLAVG